MNTSIKPSSVTPRTPELQEVRFQSREKPSHVAAEIQQRVLNHCTSERTRSVANLWFDFYAQHGASQFFSSQHPYVVTQFNAIQRALGTYGSQMAPVQGRDADAPRIGYEIIRDEVKTLARIKLENYGRFFQISRTNIIPANSWVKAELLRLLVHATSPNGLTPSLDNLARVSRPLLYLYANGGRTPGRGLEVLTDLCCHRLAEHDFREPLILDPMPSTPIQRLPFLNTARGLPHPFLGTILHDEIQRDDFLEVDSLPVVLAELNPKYKFSDDRPRGRDPEDLFSHDSRLHGNFLARFSELRGLTGQKLLTAIDRRLRFAEAFEEEFPLGSLYRDPASVIRFGFHHEGWFAYMFGNQFFPINDKNTWRLMHGRSRETYAWNQYTSHLFSNVGPWLESIPEPRHSLEWFELFRFAPSKVAEEFLTAVSKSLMTRCVPEDLGRIRNADQIPSVLQHYWNLVREIAG